MYATREDIDAAYGDELLLLIADRDNDGVVDDPAVEAALATAASTAEGYLRTRYTMPLTETPDALKRVVIDLAVYNLAADAGSATEMQESRNKAAIAWLRDVAAGRVNLTAGTPDGTRPRPIVKTGAPRRFTRDKMRDL